MASAIVDVLDAHGGVDQDALAGRSPAGTRGTLAAATAAGRTRSSQASWRGASWRGVGREAFGGMGSLGNGGAMRVAPVGAYFADDLDAVVEHARASAEVTHAHPTGRRARCRRARRRVRVSRREDGGPLEGSGLLDFVLARTPRL